jgi:hypothetical protein
MVLIERIATKLNADKTRFDPRPVGVLLTFRFRDCSRPLPVYCERTPCVPSCQYPSRTIPGSAFPARPPVAAEEDGRAESGRLRYDAPPG